MCIDGEGVRTLLAASHLPTNMWSFALLTTAFVRNRLVHSKHGKTPLEVFSGQKPDVSNLQAFGCDAYI
jgi:hypothetical protein